MRQSTNEAPIFSCCFYKVIGNESVFLVWRDAVMYCSSRNSTEPSASIVLVCLNVSSRLANVKAVSRVSLMSFVLSLPKDNQTIASINLLKISAFSITSEYGSVAIGNPERHMRKASHCGSKQQ